MLLTATGPQFQIGWVFWVLFIIWVFLGFVWYWPRTGIVVSGWNGWGNHAMITLFIFLLGIGTFGLPGIH